jgi:phosphatidylserine decarboxylase
MKTPWLGQFLLQEDLNFLLTNRIPRIGATRLMGWYSRIRSRWLTRLSLRVWRLFSDLDLSDARDAEFDSVHACFTRALRPGARTVDPDPRVLASPCDAIVGACGTVRDGVVYQAKGMPYGLPDLLGADEAARMAPLLEGGQYLTLRLTSTMYHRFHAPDDLVVEHLTYISGDTWNVNPIALKRVERLFCRNERAVVRARLLADGTPILLVPVAAVLVASMRFHFADVVMNLRWRGPNALPCEAVLQRGEEMGWFEHGSTILVFVPPGIQLAPGIAPGLRIRMGQRLLERTGSP